MDTILVLSFVIGFFAGLRSFTPPAVMAWAVHLGWLHPHRLFAWLGSLPAVIIVTLLAVVELIADKLPKTPNRTAPPGLIVRIVTGAFVGGCLAASGGSDKVIGAVLGIFGALAGTFSGFKARSGLVKSLGVPDLYIAIAEDLITIGGSLWVVSRI